MDYFAYFCSMNSKRLAIFTLSLLISNGCLAQEVSEPVAHQYKSYHGDGIDNVLEYVPTAVAFCGATTLMHEYRKVSPWIGVAGYAVATTVAVDRVRRNRHHWGDVVAGVAIGVASAEAGYWIGDIILGKGKKKKQDVSLSVAPMGMTLVARL